ncbi:hypothetical protein DXH78_01680 [Undibacter mobilis]|uniref:Tyr recombinase domain-containing protein n=2 Tax=Undibacter mobilis TaxID=2292256 RepID=A0A371BDG9_9BRAD|nr:hypothetical protein DXH78_01680 [Undibacter mobilis]
MWRAFGRETRHHWPCLAHGAAGFAHIFRHSAAVHMAEAGIAMEVIAQLLGHEDVSVTREIYARFPPTYLREAAAALAFGNAGSTNLETATQRADNHLE